MNVNTFSENHFVIDFNDFKKELCKIDAEKMNFSDFMENIRKILGIGIITFDTLLNQIAQINGCSACGSHDFRVCYEDDGSGGYCEDYGVYCWDCGESGHYSK